MNNKSVLIIALLTATFLVSPDAAFAACPGTVTGAEGPCTLGAGQSVVINSGGSITNGGGNAITIGNVAAGSISNSGTLSGSGSAIRQTGGAGGLTSITNQTGGSMISTGEAAINIDDGIITNGIVNNGTIDALNSGIRLFKSTIQNAGITLGAGSSITAGTGVELQSGGVGEETEVAGDILNSGIIDVVNHGIVLDSSRLTGDIVNQSAGSIEAGGNGIWLNSDVLPSFRSRVDDIINLGTITTDNSGDAILVEDSDVLGRIDNQNAITAAQNGIFVTESTVAEGIVNDGTINAANGYGIGISGSDVLRNVHNSGTINSYLAGILATLNSYIDGSIVNDGTIHATDGVGIGVQLSSNITGDIINNNSITADTSSGILVSGSTVDGVIRNANGASITVSDTGNGAILLLNNATAAGIENLGTLQANDGTGIGIYTGSTVTGNITNRGSITATGTNSGDGGVVVSGSTIGAIRNETNTSSIIGSLDGIKITGSIASGGILNNGTIRGLTSDGIHVGTSTFTGNIENNNIIFADSDGIDFGEGGTPSSLTGNIINGVNGVITANDNGIELGASGSRSTITGSVINHGRIIAADNGIDTNNIEITGDITNNNRIEGGDFGIRLVDTEVGGVITNAAGAYIGGSDYAVSITAPTSRATFNNYGELDGALRIEDTTLNLEEGSIASGAIGGILGIVNINANISTAEEYGVIDGTLDEVNIASAKTFTSRRGSDALFDTLVFNNDGTFRVVGNTANSVIATVSGNYNQSANAILSIDAQLPNIHSALNIGGTGTFVADTGIHVNITGNEFDFAGGARVEDVITAGTLNASTFTVTDSSYLYNFTSDIDGTTVDLISVQDATRSVAGAANTGGAAGPIGGAATVIDDIIAQGPTGDMRDVVNAIATLGTAEEIQDALQQTLPTLTGGSATAVLQTMGTTGQIIQARREQNNGLSSGDEFISSGNLWFKPFGTWSDQGMDDGVVGFDADTYGIIAGADTAVSDEWRLGAALSYANTDVKSDDGRHKIDVDSYQATLYGSYVVSPKTEANFQADIGYNNNESERIINFGGLDRKANGDFGSYSGHVGVGIGHVLTAGEGTTITPSARVDYNLIHNESYTESDAGALNLDVKSQTTDQLIPSVSAKINQDAGKGVSLSANAGVGYDVLNDSNSVTASYVGGGGAFVTKGLEPSPWVIRTGAGLTYEARDDLDLTLRYDREDRGDFDAQTISIRYNQSF